MAPSSVARRLAQNADSRRGDRVEKPLRRETPGLTLRDVAANGIGQVSCRMLLLAGLHHIWRDGQIGFAAGHGGCAHPRCLPPDAFRRPIGTEPVVWRHVVAPLGRLLRNRLPGSGWLECWRLPEVQAWDATLCPLKYTSTVRAVILTQSFCFRIWRGTE
jgi:hypothetical protein